LVTPEPATVVMMFAGSPLLVGYVLVSRRRRATRAVDAAA
jgi:PEP-CTERM motif